MLFRSNRIKLMLSTANKNLAKDMANQNAVQKSENNAHSKNFNSETENIQTALGEVASTKM